MSIQVINWKIAGRAGDGVMVVSKLLAKAYKRHGWFAFNYLEYPSLIKGGHQTGQVSASPEEITSQRKLLDILIAFNKDSFIEHQDEFSADTLVVYNSDDGDLKETQQQIVQQAGIKLIELSLGNLAREAAQTKLVMNVVALGVSTYLLGLDKELTWQVVADEFAEKGEAITQKNKAAFEKGFIAIQEQTKPMFSVAVKQTPNEQILLTGNEAVGLGAVAAGLQYFSAYPMTPASALMHYLAAQQTNYPLVVKHVEDEIAAINQALGASYAGVRSMTGTSGGGFALMVEGLALAGVTELPLVILYGMRPGPATGLPTWTSQADLQFVLRAGHGEFQRVVMTPGTIAEHYELTKQAFVLAEKYQIPVFILSDKYALESHQTTPKPDSEVKNERYSLVEVEDLPADDSYRRYAITDSGISPRSVPGQAHGLQVTNSYEHDEFGYATEDAQQTVDQTDKRMRKMTGIAEEVPQPVVLGVDPEAAKVTFVSWGSTVNVLRDLVARNKDVSVIHLPCVWPFPVEAFSQLANKAKKLVMVEGNATGQAEQLVRQETGIKMTDSIRRYDGRPFYVTELEQWMKENL